MCGSVGVEGYEFENGKKKMGVWSKKWASFEASGYKSHYKHNKIHYTYQKKNPAKNQGLILHQGLTRKKNAVKGVKSTNLWFCGINTFFLPNRGSTLLNKLCQGALSLPWRTALAKPSLRYYVRFSFNLSPNCATTVTFELDTRVLGHQVTLFEPGHMEMINSLCYPRAFVWNIPSKLVLVPEHSCASATVRISQ